MVALLVAAGVTVSAPPPTAQASIDVGTASQTCSGLVTFNMSTIGVSLGYTLVAFAGRTQAEVESGQHVMGVSTTPWPVSMVLANVSGTWQSPWPGQDLIAAVQPSSFPWGSFALNFATSLKVPVPEGCPVSIGDYVWADVNRNGVQDPGEKGVPNTQVVLTDANGAPAGSTTTDANGFYSFTNLTGVRSGSGTIFDPYTYNRNYTVRFVPPAGYTLTQQGAGSDPAKDSNPNSSGVTSITIPKGGFNSATSPDDPTIDAGLIPPIDLSLTKALTTAGPFRPGDTVSYTLTPTNNGPGNALGGWSVTEVVPPGLSLVSMSGTGYTCTGAVCTNGSPLAAGASAAPITVTATISSSVGAGVLRNVAYISPAPAEVPETIPLGTPPAPGTDTSTTPTNNDADAPLTVAPLVSIGDYVWADTNRNGIQDAGEKGIPNVTVNLRNAAGTQVATTTTDANGFYVFRNLSTSTGYTVQFVTPTGYALTTPTAGTDRTKDSNPASNGLASVTTPASGKNSATTPDDPTIDAGMIPPIDLTLSKALTSTAPFRPGATVTYTLTPKNLGPGDAKGGWSVTEVVPNGLTLVSMSGTGYSCTGATCTNAAGLAAGASAAPITVTAKITATTAVVLRNVAYVSPASGEVPETNPLGTPPAPGTDTSTTPTNNDADAPLTVAPVVSIGDDVWLDLNRNGIQDAGEQPVAGVVVNLKNASGAQIATTTTNASGFYSFTGLEASTAYTVQFIAPSGNSFTLQAAGPDRAKDSNPAADGTAPITTPANGNNSAAAPDDSTIDAGLTIDLRYGDLVWKKVDPAGQALAGSTWTLTSKALADGSFGAVTTITDCVAASVAACTGPDKDPAGGQFRVTGLLYGTYDLGEAKAPAGYKLLTSPIAVTIGGPTTVLSDVPNQPQDVPAIPLTGGLGSDAYAIAGGLALLVMLGLGAGELLRRRRTAR